MSYQGHLPDGSSVQKHSAGSCYPYVVFGQETPEGLRYGVITPLGYATEAKQIVEKGFAAGALGTGAEAERHKRLRDLAVKQETETAAARGAKVIAITESQSPLARKADLALIVDHVEDVATHLPMVSRILHLLVIDILAVGVAMKLGKEQVNALPQGTTDGLDEAQPLLSTPAAPVVAQRVAPGVSTAGPLSQLTSHSR